MDLDIFFDILGLVPQSLKLITLACLNRDKKIPDCRHELGNYYSLSPRIVGLKKTICTEYVVSNTQILPVTKSNVR